MFSNILYKIFPEFKQESKPKKEYLGYFIRSIKWIDHNNVVDDIYFHLYSDKTYKIDCGGFAKINNSYEQYISESSIRRRSAIWDSES